MTTHIDLNAHLSRTTISANLVSICKRWRVRQTASKLACPQFKEAIYNLNSQQTGARPPDPTHCVMSETECTSKNLFI